MDEDAQRKYDMFHKPYRARTWTLDDLVDTYVRLRATRAHGERAHPDFLDYETALVAALEKALGVKIETVRHHTAPDGTVHTHYDGFDGRSERGYDFTNLADYYARVDRGPFGVWLEGSPDPAMLAFQAPLNRQQRELLATIRQMLHQLASWEYPDAAQIELEEGDLVAVGFDPRVQREPDEVMYW
jgi:hypothetical protein